MWLNGLELAVGYSVRGYNVIAEPPYPLKENYYLGVDLNLLSILPNHDSRWHWVAQTLNFIKLPSPMIEFTDNHTNYSNIFFISSNSSLVISPITNLFLRRVNGSSSLF